MLLVTRESMFIRMTALTIRTTYALRSETVHKLDGLARRWKTNRSEALRRIIDLVDEEERQKERFGPLEALEAMHGLPDATKAAWANYQSALPEQRLADDAHRGF